MYASDMWVRNFTKENVPYVNINETVDPKDYFTLLKNEIQNARMRYPWIDTEGFYHEKIIIVSDGYKFAEKQKLLAGLPRDVAIMGVNGALVKWKLPQRTPNYYVVNNPYPECMQYLPRRARAFPKCIASTRTNFDFLAAYKGTKYRYYPVSEQTYSGLTEKEIEYQIDDYRNIVCAAIGLAYRFGAAKLLLFCCDDTFDDERPGAEQLPNGLWMYPQQRIVHGLLDASLYWLKDALGDEIEIADHSSGPYYDNAAYIGEDKVLSFFDGAEHDTGRQ